MTQRKANLILASISVVWGSSNLMLRLGLEGIETFNLIALRFGIAFLIVAVLFHRELLHTPQKTLPYSIVLGFMIYVNFAVLIWALQLSTVSEVGFLTSISVVLVPVFCSVIRKNMPEKNIIAAMLIVIIGFALMNLESGINLSLGTLVSLLAAVINALIVIVTSYAAHHCKDTLVMGIWQIGFTGFFGLITSMVFEKPTLPKTGIQLFAVLVLAVLCSAYGYVMRPVAQRYTTSEQVGFLLTLEPVFSALFAFFVLGERLKFVQYVGAALVLVSVLVANNLISIFKIRSSSIERFDFHNKNKKV